MQRVLTLCMSGVWWKAVSQRLPLQQVWLWVTLEEVWMAKFKFITTHLKARWGHWVIKPCLMPDRGSNILCILKQDEDFHIDNRARFFPLFSLVLHGLFLWSLSLFHCSLPLLFKQQDFHCSLSSTRIICYHNVHGGVFIFLIPLLQRPLALSNFSWKKFFQSLLLHPCHGHLAHLWVCEMFL